MRYENEDLACHVFVEREGLLKRVGHDLKLAVTRLWVELEGDRIVASFDPASFVVRAAIVQGSEHDEAFSARDRESILENIKRDVLETNRFPSIRFTSQRVIHSPESIRVEGTLDLHGVQKALSLEAVREHVGSNARYVTRLSLHQPDFGIRPYSAMLGALKVKPDVRIVLSMPAN